MPDLTFDQQVTFLYTRDLEQTAAFYEHTLDLPLVLDQGPCRIYRVAADAFLGVCTKGEASPNSQDVVITLVSQDVDGWYERLRNRGVTFHKPPAYNAQYNIYHCFLRDPNGYLLEIQRFHDPAWPARAV